MPRLQNSQRGILGTYCCTSNVNSSLPLAQDDSLLELPRIRPLLPRLLAAGVAGDANHRGTQQAVFVFVATLQLFEHVMIRNLGGIHHLDRFVNPRIERLSYGGNWLNARLLQCILKLTIDEFN